MQAILLRRIEHQRKGVPAQEIIGNMGDDARGSFRGVGGTELLAQRGERSRALLRALALRDVAVYTQDEFSARDGDEGDRSLNRKRRTIFLCGDGELRA